MKAQKLLVESKIEQTLKERETCETLFAKKQQKIQKLEAKLEENNKNKEESFSMYNSSESSKEKEKEFEKLKEKVRAMKNLRITTERIQERELKTLEIRLKKLKQEDSQLDNEMWSQKEVKDTYLFLI